MQFAFLLSTFTVYQALSFLAAKRRASSAADSLFASVVSAA